MSAEFIRRDHYGSIGASDYVASGNDKSFTLIHQALRCNPIKPWLTLQTSKWGEKNRIGKASACSSASIVSLAY